MRNQPSNTAIREFQLSQNKLEDTHEIYRI